MSKKYQYNNNIHCITPDRNKKNVFSKVIHLIQDFDIYLKNIFIKKNYGQFIAIITYYN